jgi:hypothetical protein
MSVHIHGSEKQADRLGRVIEILRDLAVIAIAVWFWAAR